MISYEIFRQIRHLRDEKKFSAAQIAAELGLNLKTAEKWVRQTSYRPRRSPRRPSKLDPFKGEIVAMLERHAYTAQQIFQELKARGFGGGYGVVKEWVRQVRPARQPAYLTLEFAPGECAQVDWGSGGEVPVGGTRRRLSFLVMVLCSSRMMYVEFTLGQGMEHFLSCLQRGFEFFGGVPAKVMIDNLKTGVLGHPFGEPARFHPRFLDFAAHYGFQPAACGVRKPNEKGRVENGVGYLKKNFLAGLNPPAFEAVNPAARQWLDTVANVRPHGETRRKPLEMFAEEKPRLGPLPVLPYDPAVLRRILDDRFVATFDAAETYDKDAFIKIFAGDVDPTASQSLTYDAVIIDGDTAVLVGNDTARGTRDGAAYTTVYKYTATYIHRHGRWLALAEHIVEVPQAK